MELSGQTALVIGGTNGIGRAVALELGKRGARVTVVGRDKARGEETAKQIGGGFRRCDASLIKEVRRVVHETVQDEGHVDICVMTQGIATVQGRTETPEGLDVKMALHYYGRVAAMEALRDARAFSLGSHPRMLTVLSGGIHSPYVAQDGDWELRNSYSLKNAANACGFYNDVAVTQLAKLVPGLRAVHASPGVVKTAWGTEMPPYIRVFVRAIQLFATPAEKAASMLVEVLLRKEDGAVIANSSGKELAPLPQMTREVSDSIWKHTEEVLERIR